MSENKININEQQKSHGALRLLKKICAEKNIVLNSLKDGRLGFPYVYGDNQCEYFVVEANDEDVNIKVIDYCWHEVSKWDIEEVTRLQTLINVCNSSARCKVVYHFDDEDKMILSTEMVFPLFSDMSYSGDYFVTQLDHMLQVHDFVLEEQEENTEKAVEQNEVSTDSEEGTADSAPEAEANDSSENEPSFKETVIEALRKMQCDPVIWEESDGNCSITFEFQAEQIYFKVYEGCNFISLFDGYWYCFDATDIEQLCAVKKIINDINRLSQLNIFYSKEDDDNEFNVHIQTSLICTPEVDLAVYLRQILRECFTVHNLFFKMLAEANVDK